MKHSRRDPENLWTAGQRSRRNRTSRQFTRHRSLSGVSGITKRSIDLVLALIGLLFLAPVIAAVATVIYLRESGPVLYRQIRVGLNGSRFTILKFRTMIQDAEEHLGAIWALPDDPRCTRTGGFLRRFGLDELPQLWNVARGDMSLIGPRPERPEFIAEFRQEYRDYDLRQTVRPGLTGYAQVHGWRGYTSLASRLEHDLYYIQHWSLSLDLWILLAAFFRGWSKRTRQGVR